MDQLPEIEELTMWHRVASLASTHQLPVVELEAFAGRPDNFSKFGIVNEFGYPEINTWHCNAFVLAFKEENQL